MTAFQCNFPGATSNQPVAKGRPPRRCGAEPNIGKKAAPWNCTVGAKPPFDWFQNLKGRNNLSISFPRLFTAVLNKFNIHLIMSPMAHILPYMHEGTYSPPLYTTLYDFQQGAQSKIFVNSDISGGTTSPNRGAILIATGPPLVSL